jgi:nucleotide-binding universal stress UspA family protein
MKAIQTIVVASDFSENAMKALLYALSLAKGLRAALYVVHVVYDLQSYIGAYITDIPLTELQKNMEKEAKAKMEEFCQTHLQDFPSYKSEILTGSPALQILQFAKEKKADMIVMGAHGTPKPEHLLFGSTVERVMKMAPCPVTVVRDGEV